MKTTYPPEFFNMFMPEVNYKEEEYDEWAETWVNQQAAMYERMILSGYCRTDH